MIPRLKSRIPNTRARRGNMGEPRLEGMAAEFALLAQRRSRELHQLNLLDQQHAAAIAGYNRLHRRIAWLVQRMDELNPDLRNPAAFAEPEPEPPPPPPPVRKPPASLAAIGRQWIATPQPTGPKPPVRPVRTRRT